MIGQEPVHAAVPGAIWITWERHRRTREIARALGIPLFEILSSRSGAARYAGLVKGTIATLRRERPRVLLVQCPSIILGALVARMRRVFGYRLVADLHNEAVTPFALRARWYTALVRSIHRGAALSIVTNAGLVATVEGHGGHAFVLPDPIPQMQPATEHSAGDVVFICTFAPDEPWRAVIDAASMLPPDVTVHVTGRAPAEALSAPRPANVTLTGYLAHEAYDALLARAAVVMDLTAMEDCLVCGAYEAVAVGVPLVTSDTTALRRHFSRGAVFTSHDPASIARSIQDALDRRRVLADEMVALRQQLRHDWDITAQALASRLAKEA